MSNVVSMESKLEELERNLLWAESNQLDAIIEMQAATHLLEKANTELAAAIEALEKHV